MAIATLGIVGAGLMGSGIAEVAARSGVDTTICEVDQRALDTARQRIQRSLERGRSTGKLSDEQVDAILSRIAYSTDVEELAPADIVVEAIAERLSDKVALFEKLDRIARDDAILATNTSSLPIIEIARATERPEAVVGTHFFNPPPVMKLLELVRSVATSEETMAQAKAFGEQLGKRIIVAQDRGGFIVNLLLIPFLTHAVRVYESGFATREDIDEGMRLGCGHPMGPLQLLDYIGLDTALFVCEALYEEYANADYAPPPLLRRMVAAGWLGQKSGRGFYEYPTRRYGKVSTRAVRGGSANQRPARSRSSSTMPSSCSGVQPSGAASSPASGTVSRRVAAAAMPSLRITSTSPAACAACRAPGGVRRAGKSSPRATRPQMPSAMPRRRSRTRWTRSWGSPPAGQAQSSVEPSSRST